MHTGVMRRYAVAFWLTCITVVATAADTAKHDQPGADLPSIALIIDDLGNQRGHGERAVTLPGPVACAFLPQGPYTGRLARQAHLQDKEVMLHLPMQAVSHSHAHGEGRMLTLDMTHRQLVDTLDSYLDAIPHVSGLNNHMGSLLTRHPGYMEWLMQSLGRHGPLFFVDSRTTDRTVAGRLAREHGIPSIDRNVFLDNDPDVDAIRTQFRRLLDIAQRKGTALGIGHPHPATLGVLEEELANLGMQGVRLVPVAQLIELQNRRTAAWQASLSP